MADWFTADQRWTLIRRYGLEGPKTPEEMAIEEACELSPEVRELWATRDKWSRHSDDFSRLLWPRVFRVLGLADDEEADETSLRDPLPVPETTRVLELRLVEQLSWPEIEAEVDLSHRKVDYIRKAILHEDLGWDEAGNCPAFGPLTRNSRGGIVLPRR